MNDEISALILAAGRGSRMGELTDQRPKCMLKLEGTPLLKWQVRALSCSGIRDITVITGYCREIIEKSDTGLKTRFYPSWNKTNMVGTLFHARDLILGQCIVSYSDIVYHKNIVETLCRSQHPLTIVVDLDWRSLWEQRFNDPLEDAESLSMDPTGKLLRIGEKEQDISQIEGQYIGLLKFTPESIRWIEDLIEADSYLIATLDMTSLLSLLIEHGFPIATVTTHGQWCEIDSKSDYELANRRIADGLLNLSGD